MKKRIKLSQWAKLNGYTYRGAYNLYHTRGIEGAEQTPSGAILIDVPEEVKPTDGKTVVYARVSSSENRTNLDTQAERVCSFCAAKGWIVNEVVKECASGMNDKRPKLQKILADKQVTRIVVEHKDRLTRFGFEYIKTLFDGDIVIINEVDQDDKDLMQDFVSLVTSFCARIYGQRRCRRKTEKLLEEMKTEP